MSNTRVRELSAIMFADMVGFTALMQKDEAEAKARRDRHRDVVTGCVADHGGKVIQFYGDGSLSLFRSAIQAVSCAVAIQEKLREEPRIPVRVGIHTGDVVHDREGAYGDGVNVAARIESLSEPGGILVSGKVYDEIKNQPWVRAIPRGRVHLKNVERPLPVFAIANEGLGIPSLESIQARAGGLERSVAVLPFVNMSADPENEFFSDGISEEIINALTRIQGLNVTSRTSSFAYKGHGKDVRTIGAELGVGTVLEGSVRKAGSRVRITAQLINADDGYHLFSEAWNRDIDDVFEVQDEIARRIAEKLEAELSARQAVGPLVRRPTENLNAYNRYLQGLFYWNKWTPDSVRRAFACFDEAIGVEPDFALPHAGIAYAAAFLGAHGTVPPHEIFPKAQKAAQRALELDPSLAQSHLALGLVRLFYDWDWEGARRQFETALQLNPGSADAHFTYGLYLGAACRTGESVHELEAALRLDPLAMPVRINLAQALMGARRYPEALAQCERVIEMEPSFRAAHEGVGWVKLLMGDVEGAIEAFRTQADLTDTPHGGLTGLGYAYSRAGRLDEARRCFEKTLQRRELQPETSVNLDLAIQAAGLGETDRMFSYLEAAADERLGALVFVRSQAVWDEHRDDPRFRALLRRIGFPDEEDPPRA